MQWGGSVPVVAQIDRSAPVPHVIRLHKFGYNPTVGTSEEFVTQLGGTTYGGFLMAPSQLRIRAGGSASDTAGGAGAQTVILEGMDASGNLLDPVTLTTAGALQSDPTSVSFIRMQRAYCGSVGTYATSTMSGGNVGPIIIETTSGVAVAEIAAQRGQTQIAVYTIPLGYRGYLIHVDAKMAGSTAQFANIRIYKRENALDFSAPFSSIRVVENYPEIVNLSDDRFEGSVSFEPLTDVWATAQRVGGGGDVAVNVSFGIELRKV